MAFLEELPLDVLLVVLRDLTVEDIINLRMVCFISYSFICSVS